MTRPKTTPEEARRIAGYAWQHLECNDCGATAGAPWIEEGRRRAEVARLMPFGGRLRMP